MTDLAPFPDIETAVMDALAGLGTCDTYTPSDLAGTLPFIRVRRIGGTDDRVSDTARVDIDVYEDNRPDAHTLAEAVRQRLISAPRTTAAGTIDKVVTDIAPNEVPWGNPAIRHFTSSYSISSRR